MRYTTQGQYTIISTESGAVLSSLDNAGTIGAIKEVEKMNTEYKTQAQ